MLKDNKQIIVITITFLMSCIVFGQDKVANILKSYTKALKEQESYQVGITYKIYNGHLKEVPHETTTGVFLKLKEKQYTKIDGVEILNTPNIHIKVNHKEKAILVADGVVAQMVDLNFEELFKYLQAKITKETASKWIITFSPNGNGLTQLPFEKLLLEIEKNTFRVQRQVFFYFQQMNFAKKRKEKDISKVKFEVLYKNYKTANFSISKNVFNSTNYILLKKTAIVPINKYGGYEIVDARSKREKGNKL